MLDGPVRSAIAAVKRANRRRDGIATRQVVDQVRLLALVRKQAHALSPRAQIVVARVGRLEAQINAKVDALKGEMTDKVDALRSEMTQKMEEMKATNDAMKATNDAILALLQAR